MTLQSAPTRSPDRTAFTGLDYGLYATVILLWGTSWIGIHLQLGVVSPEVSVLWRYVLATLAMVVWVRWRGETLIVGRSNHLRFAALGLCLFSANYLCFYYSGLSTPSGLLAVVFSLASVGNMILGALLFGTRPTLRMVAGAALGFLGVAAMFEPQIMGTAFDHSALVGLLLAVAGTTLFCIGNMVSTAFQRTGMPVLTTNAWAMGYGTLYLFVFVLVRGQPLVIEPTLAYIGSLLWLALVSSVIGFAAYLTLLGRVGAGRAGYSTVVYPVLALGLSSLVEGYQWTAMAIAGLVLVLCGNILVLTQGRTGR